MKRLKYMMKTAMILTLVCSMGCVEEFDANLNVETIDGLVIEGNIVSDSIVVFKLSKTLPLTQTEENADLFENYWVTDAELAVKGDDGSIWKGAYLYRKGDYAVPIGNLNPNVKYHLEILYNGDTYQSEPQIPLPCSGIEGMSFSQPDLAGPVTIRLDSKETDLSETKYYMWYFEEDWELHAHFVTTDLYDPELDAIVSYDYPPVAQGWCYNGTDEILLGSTEATLENRIIGKIIQKIEHTDDRLSVLYSIRVQQRNLTRQEYEYYQERNKLSSGMGGLFTPQPSELPTNVVCSNPVRKVIGYVGCNMGVAYHQLYIDGEEVFYEDVYECLHMKEPSGAYKIKYAAGFQIASLERNGGMLEIEWARFPCVDIRSCKANPTGRPSWWPNPYLYYKEEPEYGGF